MNKVEIPAFFLFFVLFVCLLGLLNYLPGVALNHDPPDFSLLNSYDYRNEPLAPGTQYGMP
jgi:hypothetical protein